MLCGKGILYCPNKLVKNKLLRNRLKKSKTPPSQYIVDLVETSSASDEGEEGKPLDPGDESELEDEAAKYHNPDWALLRLRKGVRKEAPLSPVFCKQCRRPGNKENI